MDRNWQRRHSEAQSHTTVIGLTFGKVGVLWLNAMRIYVHHCASVVMMLRLATRVLVLSSQGVADVSLRGVGAVTEAGVLGSLGCFRPGAVAFRLSYRPWYHGPLLGPKTGKGKENGPSVSQRSSAMRRGSGCGHNQLFITAVQIMGQCLQERVDQ